MLIVASKSIRSSPPGPGAAPASHACWRAAAPRRPQPLQMRLIDAVQQPPRRRHRGHRLAWARTYLKGMGLLTNSSRGVWALTDDSTALLTDPSATDDQRSERIQEPQQRRAPPAGQARLRGQFPQQSGPGMRHHAPPVRADLDPALPATTLHPRSAFLPEGHRSFASSIFLCRQGTSSHLKPVSAYRRQTPRLASTSPPGPPGLKMVTPSYAGIEGAATQRPVAVRRPVASRTVVTVLGPSARRPTIRPCPSSRGDTSR